MSEPAPAPAISFFDPSRELYGTAREAASVLFEGRRAHAVGDGPKVERRKGRVRVELEGSFALELEPVAAEADLGGVVARLCRVTGEIGGTSVDCVGTIAESKSPPAWDELDAMRSISAIGDAENAVLALARRPRGALGHGHELVTAWLLEAGEPLAVEEARISTVYDGDGRQRSAGLELWLPGEEFPRRVSGSVIAGSSLELEELNVHIAVFRWRMNGRDATGAYELVARREPAAAA
ncbi:MAG: hypothetical protein ABR581_04135 [Thermoleophilaceae bacterium]